MKRFLLLLFCFWICLLAVNASVQAIPNHCTINLLRRLLIAIFITALTHLAVCAQSMYSLKNVDRTAMSFFDGQQTFRALEYYTDPQLTNKVYRLEMLPENGLPGIILKGKYQGAEVYFEDKVPYDDQFTDNATPYLSSEGVQVLYGFQKILKEIDKRFNWKGLDGGGIRPIQIYIKNSDEELGSLPGQAIYYGGPQFDDEYFVFYRSVNDNLPFNAVLEIIGHEMGHAIFLEQTGIVDELDYLCLEYRTVEEGISDILGIYLKNKIKQYPPTDFSWLFGEQYKVAEDFANPKAHQFADTYNGQYFVNTCTEDLDPHPGGGVAQKWFVLLSDGFQGSTYNDLGLGYSDLTGIGPEKAIQIVWDAIPLLKTYSSDYPAFRFATLKTAEKLYGLHSTEYLAVQNAWCAVGVCDNNTATFSMYPANTTNNVNPWPTTKINLTWTNSGVTKWRVQTSTKYDFSENVQETEADNFTMVVDPNGLLIYSASIDAYYHPGEKVYARAKISEAVPNFCKGLNPLCAFYQQFGPTHAFTLEDQQVKFWPYNSLSMVVNPWDKPELRWKSIDGADRYRIQVATDNVFNNLIYDEVALHTSNFTESTEINTTLDMGHDYFVRVRAERLDFVKINKNYGKWSDIFKLHTAVPVTSILPALKQKPGDPPKIVSSLGFWVNWYAYAGASHYVIQAASDPAFANVLRSQTVAGNLTSIQFALPAAPDQTH
ncbi:MAG: M4 family metallopeptidase, partial [Dyadobacter sp.]|uniref:M4 family metallopeptidase n=1 Tax=Dyadobacter sp. TaxID=1914288 RepID=UPI001B27D4D2